MIAKFKARALMWSVPGLAVQALGFAGLFAEKRAAEDVDPAFTAVLLLCIGTALLVFGLYFYALAKSRRAAWALAGLASLPGFLVVHFLPDANRATPKKKKGKRA